MAPMWELRVNGHKISIKNALGMIGESEDLATSLLSDADMNHDSKIDLDGKDTLFSDIFGSLDGFSEFIYLMSWI